MGRLRPPQPPLLLYGPANSRNCKSYLSRKKNDVARVPGVACMNPSEKGEELVRVGIILCTKSMCFLPETAKKKKPPLTPPPSHLHAQFSAFSQVI